MDCGPRKIRERKEKAALAQIRGTNRPAARGVFPAPAVYAIAVSPPRTVRPGNRAADHRRRCRRPCPRLAAGRIAYRQDPPRARRTAAGFGCRPRTDAPGRLGPARKGPTPARTAGARQRAGIVFRADASRPAHGRPAGRARQAVRSARR
ncbi:hypothetical protein G6F68_014612 [Rhizopus microsporus]|nr:hypothetical protein G6F68_014612 [Rhizopus microsporus]